MTTLAIRRKSDLLVIRIRSSVVVRRMTAIAVGGSALVATAEVTRGAVQRRMLPGQCKSR